MMRLLQRAYHLWYRAGLHVLCFTARIFYRKYPTVAELAPSREERRREYAELYQQHMDRFAALERERSP
ncbi:MAG: hypothetical protein IPK60_20905 [Sandaracinaceae bacterium]|nr:hypothetical protein [Sandaracinaceae bacterium]